MANDRVLVIDDELVVLNSVNKILAAENYAVDLTLSGLDGRDRAVQNTYDIVLTDIRMPDIGGMRVLRDVKRAKPSTPVVIITGYPTVRSAVMAMKLGAADYLEKPFTPDELVKVVDSALKAARTQPPEKQAVIHRELMISVLERAASDCTFFRNLLEYTANALDEYDLTGPEKLALLTGDIEWIEEQIGPLTTSQRRWLEARKSCEIW